MLTKHMRLLLKPGFLLYLFVALVMERFSFTELGRTFIQLHLLSTITIILLHGLPLREAFKIKYMLLIMVSSLGFYCLFHIVLASLY
ncbi:hypothetical protein RISINGSUN_191 [Erwinia phage vB_EamM_RisingSun]|uniref:Uncharacterized protein n=2 Tax=Risingsunvirus risingsun TaxID=2560435 RepID=A0A223LJ05_9CAUD|nr:hypothetical protein FDI45_gp191 [Erwinia phage vB_EamM_RisingSun]ASU03479.1 hypothetical protein RISINGSUN_191 [Erwinia phage vB_EamM_RisingSun]ASU03722.1 hypothetical protein JOAD_193 [Erwinia phage vB_EamM_Joad]